MSIEFINMFLKPNNIQKKKNGEVFTPLELIREKCSKVPEEFWRDKNVKVLDPCCGIGNYQVVLIEFFMKGLVEEIKNERKRLEWIKTRIIYCSDICALNVALCKKITGVENVYCMDFLEKNMFDEMKFDMVIGNPPYQDTSIKGKSKGAGNNLYTKFIYRAYDKLKNNGFLLFITPHGWMAPTNKNKEVFYENYIIYLNLSECEKWFNIGSKFSYYLIQKTNEKKKTFVKCKYKNKIYESFIHIDKYKFLPVLLSDVSLSILDKFYNNKFSKISFKTTSELHNTTKKNNIQDDNDEIFKYPIKHTIKTKRYSNIKHSLSDKNKILMNMSGNLKPIYDNGELGFTQSQMYFLTDDEKYINVINSKLYMFIFDICKWSGFNNEKIFHNIPYIENVNDIYKQFNLTDEEIKLVEENT